MLIVLSEPPFFESLLDDSELLHATNDEERSTVESKGRTIFFLNSFLPFLISINPPVSNYIYWKQAITV